MPTSIKYTLPKDIIYVKKKPKRPKKKKKTQQIERLRIGWDTEYTTEQVLTHQFFILETETYHLFDYPRIETTEILDIVRYFAAKHDTQEIILISHFARAELAQCPDSRDWLFGEDCIVAMNSISFPKQIVDGISVALVDTFQLSGASLAKLGELLGIEKIDIGEYRHAEKISKLKEKDYKAFVAYALSDAHIAATYYDRLEKYCTTELEMKAVPSTIGSIAARSIAKMLKSKKNRERAVRLGYNFNFNRLTKRTKMTQRQELYEFSKTYAGGRNELYIRNYDKDVTVYDYDLVSAYITAQQMIEECDFSNLITYKEPEKFIDTIRFNPFSLGIVKLNNAKNKVKYPILHSKRDGCTIFTAEAQVQYLTPQEFLAAYHDLEFDGFEANLYLSWKRKSIIGDYQKELRLKRQAAKERGDKLEDFWLKNRGVCAYGKLLQGITERNSITLLDSTNNKLARTKIPPSQITNYAIGSFVTALVRAIAYETMNELDYLGYVCLYWTTDGFATTAKPAPEFEYILEGDFGTITRMVSDEIYKITGERKLYELKHQGKGWLGLKTRGYTMLAEIQGHELLSSFTGVQLKELTPEQKAQFMVSEFLGLTRYKKTRYPQKRLTSLTKWLQGEKFGNILETRNYNFDYDLKRKIDEKTLESRNDHTYFETIPYINPQEFELYRDKYLDFKRKAKERKQNKLITPQHIKEFLAYIEYKRQNPKERYSRGKSQNANIRELTKAGFTTREIASMLLLSQSAVSRVLRK